MGGAMTLLRQISAILTRDWDPLGVRVFPKDVDEYEEQAAYIATRLNSSDFSREDLRKYLDDAAYGFSRTWDDPEALERTIEHIWVLRGRPGAKPA